MMCTETRALAKVVLELEKLRRVPEMKVRFLRGNMLEGVLTVSAKFHRFLKIKDGGILINKAYPLCRIFEQIA